MPGDKHIVIGVTGGIAAYKSAILVRKLQQAGASVRVTMTVAATRFVGPDTFAALTRHDVPVSIFPESAHQVSENWTRHIQWGEWADLMVIAPCTANTLAKVVHGFSDSMLTATILAARCPVLLCPTMDGGMYSSPATTANLERARSLGFELMPPESGYLASGLHDTGRLPEPEAIVDEISRLLSRGGNPDLHKSLAGPLAGKTAVVTAGATREFIDAVRFISNPSTGKMGLAMARAAHALGARVVLLHARDVAHNTLPADIEKASFVSAQDLFELVQTHHNSDVFVMASAVSDFRAKNPSTRKIKKDEATDQLPLDRTPDILQWLGEHRREGQTLIGFAMETENLEQNARMKRDRKKADFICANDLNEPGAGFGSDTNHIFLAGNGPGLRFSGTKEQIATQILSHIFTSLD